MINSNILSNAQEKFDFFETKNIHANNIYADYSPKHTMRVIDICSGLGSLVKPWYDNGHNITLIELNDDFIPILQIRFPQARIIKQDYLTFIDDEEYDIYPPFYAILLSMIKVKKYILLFSVRYFKH